MNLIWGKLKKLIPQYDLSKTEDKLKLFILFVGFVIIFGVGSVTAIQLTMSPQFCSSCHEMTPEVVTWQVTSHSNFNCTECHIEPGIGNLIIHKIGAVKELYLHVTNTYERPIRASYRIQNFVCEKCHSPATRRFTYSGDLIVPHERHVQKGIFCVQCHSAVVHGDIATRNLTTIGALEAWTPAMGKKYTEGKFTRPKMNTCLECHTARKVSTKCEICHTTVTIPDNHKSNTWQKEHGPLAKGDLTYCNKCHSFSLENKFKGMKTAREYARGNVFCYKCHTQLPLGHSGEWKIIHKHQAIADLEGCLVCHEQQPPKSDSKATKTYCDQCHNQAPSPGIGGDKGDKSVIYPKQGTPKNGSHQPNWRKIHPTVVKEIGTTGGRCYDCHDRTNCYKCHTNGGKT
ncbi:MAG: NapC/NirT family cytochrome c [Carboxydocellales bacterium]